MAWSFALCPNKGWDPLPSGSPLVWWKVFERNGSHTGERVLCWGLVEQARHEHMPDEYKTSILLKYFDPHHRRRYETPQ